MNARNVGESIVTTNTNTNPTHDLVDCLIKQGEKASEYEKLLVNIYRNNCHPVVVKILIEQLAEKYQSDFKYELDLVRDDV